MIIINYSNGHVLNWLNSDLQELFMLLRDTKNKEVRNAIYQQINICYKKSKY